MKRSSMLVLLLALLLSACGTPPATPTAEPIDLEATIIAAGYTLVAQTQAALPTLTPLPPTATPTATSAFTPTIPPLPTLGATFTASPAPNSNVNDPCVNTPMPNSLTGQTIRIRVDNPTRGTINLTVYLQSGNPQGLCGYRGYVLAPGDSLVIGDLIEGCYSLWAWNPDPQDYFMVTNGTTCMNNSNSWTFDITPNGIRLR